ncbi:dipeptidase [Cesiribacter andamanensis]|uniref:Membrane dipeptidase (Peptidase family M19) n=1 Tax=Cesiribacter andamanensis AMV16 TaxID=1279009 RepID=M7MXP6_9BACT|nr:membrane dipeptidase [Cesiribacter andamanensis]EMR01213.1 Membrane dipeptidase (Peptidase family M19) [Cesiribacter andamanensis AMV16]
MNHSTIPHLPVIDLHCDLLSYMLEVPHADPAGATDMGASIFYLQQGGVKLQTMAIYSDVKPGSAQKAENQARIYRQLLQDYADYLMPVCRQQDLQQLITGSKIGTIAAIENAAGLCEEGEPLERAFTRLDALEEVLGRIFYIGITHHTENRFGGGNYSQAGLKDDGKALLDYLHGRNIAIDLAHTSDALAEGIFTYTAQRSLDIPIIASHSNFRGVWDHVRNLPDEFVQELARRQGLIGINFLRAYVNNERPEALLEHFQYGLDKGLEDLLCFGADFFYTKDFPDKSRHPFYFTEHEHAGKYPSILQALAGAGLEQGQLRKIAYENAYGYLSRLLPA